MPRNDFAFRDEHGQPGATTVLEPSILRQLDQAASESLNGDGGGTYAPTSPVIVGGTGAQIAANGTISGVSTGPGAAAGGGIILSANYLALAVARTRTVVIPLRDFLVRHDEDFTLYNESGAGSVASVSSGFSCRLPSFRLHNGFIPTSVTLRMRVGTRPGAVPASMPGFRITRLPASGVWNYASNEYYLIATRANTTAYVVGNLVLPATPNGRQFRCSVAGTSAGAEPAAFASAIVGATVTDNTASWVCETGPGFGRPHLLTLPRPATTNATANVDTYFNQGNFQDLVLTPNALGAWDSVNYTHGVAIADASGTANLYHSLRITWSLTTAGPNP